MHKVLMAGTVLVAVTCTSAVFLAGRETRGEDGYQLEFMPTALGRPDHIGQVMYKCSKATDLALCMMSAGKDLCGDDEFELIDDALHFDSRGAPLIRYRCYRAKRPIL